MVPSVFISSTYSGNEAVRHQLADQLCERGYRVLIAEPGSRAQGFIDLARLAKPDVIEISDDCLKNLASSDLVICILNGALGSPLRLGEAALRAKHFELELFSAVLQNKPLLICSMPDFEPDDEMREFIKCVLDGGVGIVRSAIVSDLVNRALTFCERPLAGQSGTQKRALTGELVRTLSIRRAAFRSIASHRMLLPFLGNMSSAAARPNLEAASAAIVDAKRQEDLHLRLARLWMAIREMLPTAPHDATDSQVSEVWDDLLGAWTSAAPWYGLHGHLYLGSVAAATGLWRLRERMPQKLRGKRELPVGTVASANYSLIQRIPSRTMRYFAYLSLRRFLDRHVEQANNKSGNLLIRGSIDLRLGNPFAARADFRKGLAILEAKHASPEQLGDAMIHLAVPLAIIGQRREARRLVDEGLGHIRGKVVPGAMLRALRKAIQIESYPLGDHDRRANFLKEVDQIEHTTGYLDQTRHFRG